MVNRIYRNMFGRAASAGRLMAGATVCIDTENATLVFDTVENAAINAGWIATYEAARIRLMGALAAELSKRSRAGAS
jgi:hypothetical protein